MIDMKTGQKSCVPVCRNHFHGNGSCDAMRDANKRADHMDAASGMEGGSAPHHPVSGMESEIAPYRGAPAAMGYDNPQYGVQHEWTPTEEEGMNSAPQDTFTEPLSADEAARNSWRALLARNVGRNVLVRFLMGTQNLVTVEGELYEVGTDYIVIYQPLWFSHISADLYSVKFVEFREPPGMTELA